jgi:hypothetical protein
MSVNARCDFISSRTTGRGGFSPGMADI